MILDFTPFIKSLDESSLPGELRYKYIYENCLAASFKETLKERSCPTQPGVCNARGSLCFFSEYMRECIRDIVDDVILYYYDVRIDRYICGRCSMTHAHLSWFLPPYSRHTMRFILTVLYTYYLHEMTVEEICVHYEIGITTLYRWIKKYHEQYIFMRVFFPSVLPARIQSDPDPPKLADVKRNLEWQLLLLLLEDISQDQPLRYEQYYRSYNACFLQSRQNAVKRRRHVIQTGRSP